MRASGAGSSRASRSRNGCERSRLKRSYCCGFQASGFAILVIFQFIARTVGTKCRHGARARPGLTLECVAQPYVEGRALGRETQVGASDEVVGEVAAEKRDT